MVIIQWYLSGTTRIDCCLYAAVYVDTVNIADFLCHICHTITGFWEKHSKYREKLILFVVGNPTSWFT